MTVEELCQEWKRGLGGASGSPLNGLFLSRVDSTQRLARTLLDQCVHEDEGPLPFVVAALEQSAGRGRQGREWRSPPGSGLYASLVIPVPGGDRLQELPIRSAAALAEFASARIQGECRIKWPNDLVVGRHKLGGILVDAVTPPSPAESWAIIGFGLNYRTPARALVPDATSVFEEAVRGRIEAPPFARWVVEGVSAVWEAVTSAEGDWAERFARLSAHRAGDTIRFRLDGKEVEGTFGGFDEHGFLRLETASGVRRIRSGEIYSW
ncbi:MAG: biotin--[acetyl-CoA-carboxylase] ligase [Thermoanaerobaculia bacterium]|nr:biotin--[acetyl-CoA-carboxylase] ligase [Thermoanaerobaculia bacterium]MBP9823983.1 biotin--[acetyl-CoA-carboxylase] ligase [Thermoanaerobaculia bacterium]